MLAPLFEDDARDSLLDVTNVPDEYQNITLSYFGNVIRVTLVQFQITSRNLM
jgi:hypothetical protein